jgi:hypothetical protein
MSNAFHKVRNTHILAATYERTHTHTQYEAATKPLYRYSRLYTTVMFFERYQNNMGGLHNAQKRHLDLLPHS